MLRQIPHALAFAGALLTSSTVAADPQQTGSAHTHTFRALDGSSMPLERYRGRVLLVVNTASLCGFTHQYESLQALYEQYESKGLTVIGVPSNDFGGQEPGSAEEIKEFCEGVFSVTFPLTEKSVVKGPDAHAFYRWARDASEGRSVPRWNFHKYLVARDGRLIAGFTSQVGPQSKRLIDAVEKALAEHQPAHS